MFSLISFISFKPLISVKAFLTFTEQTYITFWSRLTGDYINAIFAVLEGATRNLLSDLQKRGTSLRLRQKLSKTLQNIQTALTQSDLFTTEVSADVEAKERVMQTITEVNLRTYEREIKKTWEKFVESRDLNLLVADLDELFVDQQLYDEIEEQEENINALSAIKAEEVQLVCYQ